VGSIASSGSTVITAKHGRFRRRIAMAIIGVVLLLIGGIVGLGVLLTSRSSSSGPPAASVPAAKLPDLGAATPVLAALSTTAPSPDPAVLKTTLSPLLTAAALGTGVKASVVDVATGNVLLDQAATAPGSPASTAKLLTSVAALTELGPSATLTTTAVAGSTPGEVVLVGGGDPTLSRTSPSQSYAGAPTLAALAKQVHAALPAGTPISRVVVDNSLFSGPLTAPGWQPSDAPSSYAAPVTATAVDGARVSPGSTGRSGQPGIDAGAAFADALGATGATVVRGQAPAGAKTLGTVHSAPVERLVEQALSMSDNMLAEALARQVAVARHLPASFDGSAKAVLATLSDAGVDTAGVTLVDGSGLSRQDRVPAGVLAAVVRGAADGKLGNAAGLLSGLPVAGFDGTLADRGDSDPKTYPGTVRAKTGTLLGVHALAGTVVTEDGRLLAFALLADGTSGSETAAESALDDVATQLARCGCR
jgi:D-alanyl-D-alanine carboxypeptidase/D-alanyl-D-alanine-endopeptidase (penicillin-binding protein 4)